MQMISKKLFQTSSLFSLTLLKCLVKTHQMILLRLRRSQNLSRGEKELKEIHSSNSSKSIEQIAVRPWPRRWLTEIPLPSRRSSRPAQLWQHFLRLGLRQVAAGSKRRLSSSSNNSSIMLLKWLLKLRSSSTRASSTILHPCPSRSQWLKRSKWQTKIRHRKAIGKYAIKIGKLRKLLFLKMISNSALKARLKEKWSGKRKIGAKRIAKRNVFAPATQQPSSKTGSQTHRQ